VQLSQLLDGLPGIEAISGPADVPISGITSDSRQVQPGALFVAYRGLAVDGHAFVGQALARGAVAVAGEAPLAALARGPFPVPYIQVRDGRTALGWLMAGWYGHPSRDMVLVGITGTDGKTTTANLLYSMLCAAGIRAGLVSTVNAMIGGAAYDTGLHTTTPDAGDVQRYLSEMRSERAEVAVLETTSHGLAQGRVAGCLYDIAVITNITHEHLDYHGSYAAYREAKALLFRALGAGPQKRGPGGRLQPKTAILNRDDSSYGFLAGIPAARQIAYGLEGEADLQVAPEPEGGADLPAVSEARGTGTGPIPYSRTRPCMSLPPTTYLTAGDIELTAEGTTFELRIQDGQDEVRLPVATRLPGRFNVYNILAAAATTTALGLPPEAIQGGVQGLATVTGRMERVEVGQDFVALVDFAHTPNALAEALAAARGLAGPGGRVIAVFGCAGLRDRAKRAMMGEVSARLADYTVITAEDPRTEDLAGIMAETAAACAAGGQGECLDLAGGPGAGRGFVRVPDRQRAILHALRAASNGDVVIVCGKGHEQSMCFGDQEYPWSDREAVRWALGARGAAEPGEPPHVLPTWGS